MCETACLSWEGRICFSLATLHRLQIFDSESWWGPWWPFAASCSLTPTPSWSLPSQDCWCSEQPGGRSGDRTQGHQEHAGSQSLISSACLKVKGNSPKPGTWDLNNALRATGAFCEERHISHAGKKCQQWWADYSKGRE